MAGVAAEIELLVPRSLWPIATALVARGSALQRLDVIGRIVASPRRLENDIDFAVAVEPVEHREVDAKVTRATVERPEHVGRGLRVGHVRAPERRAAEVALVSRRIGTLPFAVTSAACHHAAGQNMAVGAVGGARWGVDHAFHRRGGEPGWHRPHASERVGIDDRLPIGLPQVAPVPFVGRVDRSTGPDACCDSREPRRR